MLSIDPPAFDLWLLARIHPTTQPGPIAYGIVALTFLGSGWTLLALLPWLARAKTRRVAVGMLGSVVLTATLVFFLKRTVQRARPCNSLDGVAPVLVEAPRDASFPSGHAAGSFTVAGFALVLLGHPRSRMRRGSVVVATTAIGAIVGSIALSRVYLGVHFPSDVAAGGALGLLVGILGGRLTLARPRG